MAHIYLIGGPPRTGKTTLTMRFLRERPVLAASTDAVRYTLRQIMNKNQQPDLFHMGKYTSNEPAEIEYLLTHPNEVIDVQNRESAIVWQSVRNFIKSNIDDGFDIIIEGIAVLPALIQTLEYPHTAIFLGNQSDTHFQIILKSARRNRNDWMHNLSDEAIRAFSSFNQAFSVYIESEARKHKVPYVEVRDDDFDTSMDTALKRLLS